MTKIKLQNVFTKSEIAGEDSWLTSLEDVVVLSKDKFKEIAKDIFEAGENAWLEQPPLPMTGMDIKPRMTFDTYFKSLFE